MSYFGSKELYSQKSVVLDFLPIRGTDHIEFYVGNAKQASYFYQSALWVQTYRLSGTRNGLQGTNLFCSGTR